MQEPLVKEGAVHTAVPSALYKILSLDDWKKSKEADRLVKPAYDQLFVHFSMEHQVEGVLKKKFSTTSYVVLKVDPSKLVGTIVLEWAGKRTDQYYHLYDGHIPLDAVAVEYIHEQAP